MNRQATQVFDSLMKNALALSFAQIVNRAGSAIFWILVIRHLGASAGGVLAFAMTIFSLLDTFGNLGLGAIVIREVARQRDKARAYFGHALILGFAIGALLSLLLIVLGRHLISNPESVFCTRIMALALIPASGFYWSRMVLMATENMGYISLATLIENFVRVSLSILLLLLGHGLTVIVFVFMFSKFLAFFVIFALTAAKLGLPEWPKNLHLIRGLLGQASTFSFISIFNSLFFSLSTILLTWLADEAAVGIYVAAYKLFDLLAAIIASPAHSLFPVFSRLAHEDRGLFRVVCKTAVKFVGIITLALAVMVSIESGAIIRLMYGPAMQESARVLQILIWGLPAMVLKTIMAFALLSNQLQKRDLLANVLGTSVLTIANLLLVPLWGAEGTAWAFFLGVMVFAITEFVSVQQLVMKFRISRQSLKPLMGIVAMSLVLFITRRFNLAITLTLGLVALLGVWAWTGSISSIEIQLVKKLRFIRS